MDLLEQRIQVLEQQVRLLEAEIKTTLLDLREFMLTNAQTSLRSDDKYSGGVYPAVTARSETSPVSPVVNAAVRTVSFENEQPTTPQKSRPVPRKPPAPASNANHGANLNLLATYEDWATKKIDVIGTQRTRQLILRYMEQGRFPAGVGNALLELVAVYEDNSPRANEKTIPNRPKQTIGHPTAQTIKAATSAKSETVETQNVILRLIAGVQNAGVGVRWRK